MKNLFINGSNGFLAQQICKYFENKCSINKIQRADYFLEPELLAKKLTNADIIVNVAGAPISIFLSDKKRSDIYNSRIMTTRNLMNAIYVMERKPSVVITMSAIGIYNSSDVHDENSTLYGNDFLANVCKDWEWELAPVKNMGIDLTILRCGIVLAKKKGILKLMLKPFKLGLGAVIGKGSQPVSFIHIHDFLRAFDFVLDHHITGIINFVAPKYCTNQEFSWALSRLLHKPLFIKVPANIIKLFVGQQSSMLLEGQKVIPKVLFNNGFAFKHSTIHSAVRNIIRYT